MKVDEALEHADEWIKGVTMYEGAQGWRVACATLAAEVRRLRATIKAAPVAIMDTRDALGLCAPAEEDFPALYALQGHRVALVDLGPNGEVRGNAPLYGAASSAEGATSTVVLCSGEHDG